MEDGFPSHGRSRVLIGICTRQRDALLRRLLNSIWGQSTPDHHDIAVIIVDNNDTPSVHADALELTDKFALAIVHEPHPGLVHARNRILDEAVERNVDWIIGVDDDEWLPPDWLDEYIRGLDSLNAPIIVGAKHIEYPQSLSPYVQKLQENQLPAGEPSKVFSTANYAVSRDVFHPTHGLGMRFSLEFNESGAEDYEFMMRAKYQYGLIPVKWPYAVAYEEFDGKRATFRYHFKRKLFDQVARYRVQRLHRIAGIRGSILSNVLNIALTTNRYAVFGTGLFIQGLAYFLTGHKRTRITIGNAVFRWARAIAFVPYLFGMTTAFYGKTVNADRSAASQHATKI